MVSVKSDCPSTTTKGNGPESAITTTNAAGESTSTSDSSTSGDKTLNWEVPPSGEPYPDMCLVPGQTLRFKWRPITFSGDNVEKVTKEVYESCTGITNIEMGEIEGTYNFTAEEAGDFYFVCGVEYYI